MSCALTPTMSSSLKAAEFFVAVLDQGPLTFSEIKA
jgi:hypothetical protein